MELGTLNIKDLNEDSVDMYKSCFDSNGSTKNKESIQWQFFKNPVHKTFVDIAYSDEAKKVAAIYAVFPSFFKIGNNDYVGSQSMDTITDIDFRGKGLFTKLAKNVFSRLRESDVKLVYGFPNGSSIHGFSTKLGWRVMDPVPFLFKPLRTGYFTKKIKLLRFLPDIGIPSIRFRDNSIKVETLNEFPQDVNKLWKTFSAHFKIAVIRDLNYLNWRYVEKPNEDYKIEAVFRDGVLKGFIVYTHKAKHGGNVGYIMELVYDPAFKEIGNELLRNAAHNMRKQKADVILSWCFSHSPNFGAYKRNGFLNLPEKLRPIELHFGARSFDESLDDIIHNRSDWYLSYSDSDTV